MIRLSEVIVRRPFRGVNAKSAPQSTAQDPFSRKALMPAWAALASRE